MPSNEVIINAACMGKNPTHSAAQALADNFSSHLGNLMELLMFFF
jgi:hypothetical protein